MKTKLGIKLGLSLLTMLSLGGLMTTTASANVRKPAGVSHKITNVNYKQVNFSYQANNTTMLSSSELSAKTFIAMKESSGSYTARNGQYYGRYQLNISLLRGDLSPQNQEITADQYVLNRYGSWKQAKTFWLNNGWY